MKPSILLQLDTDPRPSAFDSIVAIDAGVDRLLTYPNARPDSIQEIVHGAIFTRGAADLARTAIFIGGSEIAAVEALRDAIRQTFFQSFRVSILTDPSGSNTTAAAAVLAAVEACGGTLKGKNTAVLAATGPVGERVARLLARQGAHVRAGSRSLERAKSVAHRIADATGQKVEPFATPSENALREALQDVEVVIAAGAAQVRVLPLAVRDSIKSLKVAIDLNAVPPSGIEGVDPTDRAKLQNNTQCWGALAIGATKMKIHKKAIHELFTRNDLDLDAEHLIDLGQRLGLANPA
jgi:NADPH:quinone reductase-like Zn-dependent oxidoreductase